MKKKQTLFCLNKLVIRYRPELLDIIIDIANIFDLIGDQTARNNYLNYNLLLIAFHFLGFPQ